MNGEEREIEEMETVDTSISLQPVSTFDNSGQIEAVPLHSIVWSPYSTANNEKLLPKRKLPK